MIATKADKRLRMAERTTLAGGHEPREPIPPPDVAEVLGHRQYSYTSHSGSLSLRTLLAG